MYLKRLEGLRTDKDMTQQRVADYLECQREVYRRYEKGIRSIPVDYLVKLAGFYGTSTDYILELTDEKKPPAQAEKKSGSR